MLIASSCEEYATLEVPAAPADEQLITLAEANKRFVTSAKSIIENHKFKQSDASPKARNLGEDFGIIDIGGGMYIMPSDELTLQVDVLIEELAAETNDENFEYTLIDNALANDAAHSAMLGLENVQEFGLDDLSPQVQSHIFHFYEEVEAVLSAYERGEITEEEGFNRMQSACGTEAGLSLEDNALSAEEQEALVNTFYAMEELVIPTAAYFQAHDVAPVNGRFLRRAVRATLRILIGVAVTSLVVAIPVAAVVVTKTVIKTSALFKAAKAGYAAGQKVLIKGATIQAKNGVFKVKAPLLTGAGAGLKHAAKSWDKSWQGWKELQLGYKAEW
ncbi:MAG: hypothetical protein ACLFT3_12975 [Cyclobacteriaceae bacterium]